MTDQRSHPDSRSSTVTSRTLPRAVRNSMSNLLETAISDARNLNPTTYRPNSTSWHSADGDDHCHVCLSGSVIAGTLQATPDLTLNPYSFTGETTRKLDALNFMRCGDWIMAFKRFYKHWPSTFTHQRLLQLPKPSNTDFTGWHAFRAHLNSLESILPELRQIEETRPLF